MSSAETPDDRKPPDFNLYRWLLQVAALLVMIGAVCITLSYCYVPRSGEQKAKTERGTLELICGGQTLRLMTNEDIKACRAAGIEWPPKQGAH